MLWSVSSASSWRAAPRRLSAALSSLACCAVRSAASAILAAYSLAVVRLETRSGLRRSSARIPPRPRGEGGGVSSMRTMMGSCSPGRTSCRTGVGAKPKFGGGGAPGLSGGGSPKLADGGGGGGGLPGNIGTGRPKGGGSPGPPGGGGGRMKSTGFRKMRVSVPVRRDNNEPIQGGGGGGPPPVTSISSGLLERGRLSLASMLASRMTGRRASMLASRIVGLPSTLASRIGRLASTLLSRMAAPSPPTIASCIMGPVLVPNENRSAAPAGGGGGPGPRRASSRWAKSSP